MSQTILIRHTIPVSDEQWGGPKIHFFQWIPETDDEVLVRKTGDFTSRLWLDRSCVESLGEVDDQYLSRWVNISVGRVFVDVEVANVPDELAHFIYDERDWPRDIHHGIQPEQEGYESLRTAYCQLGEKVLQETLTTFNRLISYARNYKGQFWLHERPVELNRLPTLSAHFDSRVRLHENTWTRWRPPATDTITVHVTSRSKSVRREDWSEVQSFVSQNSKPDFVLELLANADLFVTEERRRSAIVEAVSALERAVANFTGAPKLHELRTADEAIRLDVASLKSHSDHIGFSNTVGFLLPLLFSPDVLPTNILKSCQEVIDIRNTVIHKGDLLPFLVPSQTRVASGCWVDNAATCAGVR